MSEPKSDALLLHVTDAELEEFARIDAVEDPDELSVEEFRWWLATCQNGVNRPALARALVATRKQAAEREAISSAVLDKWDAESASRFASRGTPESNGRDCIHGRLARKCETCDLLEADNENALLRDLVVNLRYRGALWREYVEERARFVTAQERKYQLGKMSLDRYNYLRARLGIEG